MSNWLTRLTGETQAKLLGLLRRSHQSITSLASALGLTDNAVRTHVAVLRRDGIVEDVGVQRETGGKPARLYGLTREGEELFPKAYALVLGRLVAKITDTEGRERALELLGAVGAELGRGAGKGVEAATTALRSIGANVDLSRSDNGWRIQGHGCPLSAVTPAHPEICELARALVAEIAGARVTECCDRSGERPRCAFAIGA